jgi:hypothetical protein
MFVFLRFYAAGFILFFPSDDPYWRWTPNHGHILMITVLFIWLSLLIGIFLLLQSSIVWFILKRRYRDLDRYSVLNDDDDDDEGIHNNSNNHQLKSLEASNGKATINIDEDSDSQIEFEQRQQYSSKI